MESTTTPSKCYTPYSSIDTSDPDVVCATNNRDYMDMYILECYMKTEYGKSINLQPKHQGSCWKHSKTLVFGSALFILLYIIVLIVGVCFCTFRARRAAKMRKEANSKFIDI
ncbi:hypothetical protein Bhyg_16650 [Pseudolycoriella hygida]|uniref:Uncharacterized protein n=1 Tax=Pseudolycoriella hygida TaxID=35572 RepID=A0A9Q0RV87_9DIPT|nr:hypothetical protein Bhyg_16650 [Pseudolycoriella hygida]